MPGAANAAAESVVVGADLAAVGFSDKAVEAVVLPLLSASATWAFCAASWAAFCSSIEGEVQ